MGMIHEISSTTTAPARAQTGKLAVFFPMSIPPRPLLVQRPSPLYSLLYLWKSPMGVLDVVITTPWLLLPSASPQPLRFLRKVARKARAAPRSKRKIIRWFQLNLELYPPLPAKQFSLHPPLTTNSRDSLILVPSFVRCNDRSRWVFRKRILCNRITLLILINLIYTPEFVPLS